MTQTDAPTVDNGVNIEALRGARQALTDAPEAAQFQWRADVRVGERHPQPLDDHRLLRARAAARAPPGRSRSRPTTREVFASEDNGATPPEIVLAALASCLTAGVATVATEPRRAAALGDGDRRGRHGPAGHPRHRRRRAQRLRRDQGHLRHRRRRVAAPTSRRSSPSRRSARRCSTSSRTRRPSTSRSPDRRARSDTMRTCRS